MIHQTEFIMSWLICGFVFMTMLSGNSAADPICNEARLVSDMLRNYNPSVRPNTDANTETYVSITFSIGRIEGLNEKDQVLTSFGWIMLFWKDELLQWNPALYNNTSRFTVPGNQIWLPEIALMNSVNQGNDLAFEAKFRATVHANGQVQWGPGFKWETSCSVKLRYFPFDQHVCKVEFTNWMYGGTQLKFLVNNPAMIVEFTEPNDEWDLVNYTVAADTMLLDMGDLQFDVPRIYFSLTLTRNPNFHVWNVLVPSMLMTFMTIMVFMLPSESGEKIGLGITVLLGFSVILLMVSDITPKSGESMPMISQYIVYSMMLTALSLVGTILVLNVHHHNPRKSVPKLVRVLLLKGLARLVCMHRPDLASENVVQPISIREQHGYIKEKLESKDGLMREKCMIPEDILAFVRKKMGDDEEEERLSQNKEEWEHAANVLDRFLLIFSFLGVTIMSSTYLGIIMASSGEKG